MFLKFWKRALAACAAVVVVALGAGAAGACTCVESCAGARGVCVTMAKQVAKGCRLVCIASFAGDPAGRRACYDDCQAIVQADKAECSVERDACDAICAMAADQACADDACAAGYRDCRRTVHAATRACVLAAGDDGAAMQACVEPGDAMLGIGRAALADCVSDPVDGLMTCIAGC